MPTRKIPDTQTANLVGDQNLQVHVELGYLELQSENLFLEQRVVRLLRGILLLP